MRGRQHSAGRLLGAMYRSHARVEALALWRLLRATAGDSKRAPPPHVYDVLKPVLLEKEKAEARLKVRPCHLWWCSLQGLGSWAQERAALSANGKRTLMV